MRMMSDHGIDPRARERPRESAFAQQGHAAVFGAVMNGEQHDVGAERIACGAYGVAEA